MNGSPEATIAGKCQECWTQNQGEGCDWAACECTCHDDEDDLDWHELKFEGDQP